MELNVIDFIRESAEFLHTDRPDVYSSVEDAVTELTRCMDSIDGSDGGWISFTSYVLFRHEEDGMIEWNLTRKLSSVTLFEPEEECLVLGYTDNSGTLKYGINLPSPNGLD